MQKASFAAITLSVIPKVFDLPAPRWSTSQAATGYPPRLRRLAIRSMGSNPRVRIDDLRDGIGIRIG